MSNQREAKRLIDARATLTRGRAFYEQMTEFDDDPWLTDIIIALTVAIDEIDIAMLQSDGVDVAADAESLVIIELPWHILRPEPPFEIEGDGRGNRMRPVPNKSPEGDVSHETTLADIIFPFARALADYIRHKATRLYEILTYQG